MAAKSNNSPKQTISSDDVGALSDVLVPVADATVAVDAADAADDAADPVPPIEPVEGERSPEAAELGASLIPMAHPDGGTCDRYELDAAGNILVPADDVGAMIEHGFVPVPTEG